MNIQQLIGACTGFGEQFFSVITCVGSSEQYSPSFFSALMEKIKEKGKDVVWCSLQGCDLGEFEASLRTSFLGQSQFFWLGDISILESTRQKKLATLVHGYQGPHTVMFFRSDIKDVKSKEPVVAGHYTFCMEPFISVDDQKFLFQFFWNAKSDESSSFLRRFSDRMTYESFMVLARYSLVLGNKSDEFMMYWYPKVVVPEQSLFTLAHYFFSGKRESFFRLFFALKEHYAVPFWTTFWSEQLWRAYHVVDLREKKRFNDAKIIGMRLPFSFLQKDWQMFTAQELLAAHDFLYVLDRQVKQGGQGYGLEYFYSSFFNRVFLKNNFSENVQFSGLI